MVAFLKSIFTQLELLVILYIENQFVHNACQPLRNSAQSANKIHILKGGINIKKFKMTVKLEKPMDAESALKEFSLLNLDCIFTDLHHLSINNNKGFEMRLDLRLYLGLGYNRGYKKDYKKCLTDWAESYWSGENGWWKCSKIKIVEV